MPEFSYQAVKKDGGPSNGVLTANDKDSAYRQLRSQGLTVLDVNLNGDSGSLKKASSSSKLSRDDVLSVTNELSVLLKAGLPIDKSLKVLVDMATKPAVIELLEYSLNTVKSGKAFSEALLNFQPAFSDFYINMVRAGEVSGTLTLSLERLAEYLENSKTVRSSVVSAMVYPAILLVVASLSIAVMLGFVVPQFESLFSDMGDSLPLLTQWVLGGGEWIQANWWLLIIFCFLFGFSISKWLDSDAGHEQVSKLVLSVPVLGDVIYKYEISKFSRTLGTLLGCGVSLLQAIKIGTETVGNVQIRNDLSTLHPAVKQGESMSLVLKDLKSVSPIFVQMVRVGEESGSLDKMFLELAKVFDGEVQAGIKRALTLLEPVLILFMGGAIALIIIAILMGILSVNNLAI